MPDLTLAPTRTASKEGFPRACKQHSNIRRWGFTANKLND